MNELLNKIERRATTDQPEEIKRTIRTAAQEGEEYQSYHEKKIIAKVIEVIRNEELKEEMRSQKSGQV